MNALVIVDPQNDFINGSLAVPGAEKAINNTIEFIGYQGPGAFDPANWSGLCYVKSFWIHCSTAHGCCRFCLWRTWPSSCWSTTRGTGRTA